MGEDEKINDEEVHIEKYNPSWPEKFEREKVLIEHALGAWIHNGIHHVGSTSVPGLDAKPIVDILVGVNDLTKAKECIPMLEKIGYCHYPYRPEMIIWFCKPSPAHREFHLQLMEPSHDQWNARLAFRDYLRNHPETVKEYALLKRKLAIEHQRNREAYTEAKTSFVNAVVAKALNNE